MDSRNIDLLPSPVIDDCEGAVGRGGFTHGLRDDDWRERREGRGGGRVAGEEDRDRRRLWDIVSRCGREKGVLFDVGREEEGGV